MYSKFSLPPTGDDKQCNVFKIDHRSSLWNWLVAEGNHPIPACWDCGGYPTCEGHMHSTAVCLHGHVCLVPKVDLEQTHPDDALEG